MIITVAGYRTLVVSSYVFAFLPILFDALWPNAVPAALTSAYEASLPELSTATMVVMGACILILLPAALICGVGLMCFRRWARPLAVITTILGVLAYPVLGATVQSGWSGMFDYLSAFTWGAAVALSYRSQIAERFGPE
jgi:urea transporter